jgi:hypothetical protein
MDDRQASREELLAELEALRARVAALERRPAATAQHPQTARPSRQPLQTRIEFIADFDVVAATGLDLSSGGICFESGQPLPFEMQFEIAGQQERRRAHLVWARPLADGGSRLGLRFVESEPFPTL